MYGDERTRGIRHRVAGGVSGRPVTEEEWTRHMAPESLEEAKKLSVFGGRIFGSPDIVVRWNADADPLDVAAFIAATLISENSTDVLNALRDAFGPTKEVI